VKRIVILIDGTWNKEGDGADTNVAKLDPKNKSNSKPFIKPIAADGIAQHVHYHDGVGIDGNWLAQKLGGTLGFGLKKIVQDAYGFVVDDYASGDEIYIFGFSRGAYAARALAGLIGASGIQRQHDTETFEVAWKHYRVDPKVRKGEATAGETDKRNLNSYRILDQKKAFHDDRSIKCVGVWDTVGSYGVPAGFGLESLERYIALAYLGFHDTHFGDHIDFGIHALAIDEQRRPFVPTFWTMAKGKRPKGHVEQTWFPGVHANIGGSYQDSGLSDRTLIWMMARVMSLTGLEFDSAAVKFQLRPNIDGEVYDSSKGIYLIDQVLPHHRVILSPVAIRHGIFLNTEDPSEEHINERVHWSALEKRGRPCTVFGRANTPYNPVNLPAHIPADKTATITHEERLLTP
jgi:uncharacterized protein (DUF2235 family)